MRFESVVLDKISCDTEGIRDLNISRLGSVVALVGRNGSGKSRILRLLEREYIPRVEISDVLEGKITCLPVTLSREIRNMKVNMNQFLEYSKAQKIQKLMKQYPKDEKLSEKYRLHLSMSGVSDGSPQARQKDSNFTALYTLLNQKVSEALKKYFRRINYSEVMQLQTAIGGANESKPFTFEKLVEHVGENDDYNEFKSIHGSALNYLAKLPHQLVHDLDECYGDQVKFQDRIGYKRFASLKKLIKDFLNKDLDWEKESGKMELTADGVTSRSRGIWKLNGKIFDYNKFSDGEKTLFAYCLLFFLLDQNPNIRAKDCIIVIDEPELHLHPESELSVLRGIKKFLNQNGQLWIATHSISILSDLSYDEIFLVKDDEITPPSKTTPGKSFIELMGLEEHIEKLSHFVINISNWAFLNFMTQCFSNPDVIISAKENDPEVELFKKSIKSKPEGSFLLDFGAGKGRIFNEFSAEELKNSGLQYHALEPEESNFAELEKLNFKGIYKSYNDLPTETFDYVLFCNVLHEIPILEWELVLNKVIDSLKPDGFIIIIEDMRLPKGERIEDVGFLILDQLSLKELFDLPDLPGELFSSDERYKDRILCSLIGKPNLNKVDVKSIVTCLKTLQTNVYNKIKKIRNMEVTDENVLALGRESAFYSQLYLNALLGVEKLRKGTEKKLSEMN